MTKGFDIAVAWLQLLLLALWEVLGALYFGWSPLAIFLCWIVGVWTLNIATATVLRTFIKLTTPASPDNVVNLHAVTEEDGVA
jgi:hypothetical protein